jgi:hypothetical protein
MGGISIVACAAGEGCRTHGAFSRSGPPCMLR